MSPGPGDYNSPTFFDNTPPAGRASNCDEGGWASSPRTTTPPTIEWEREYGDNGPLWAEGQHLLHEGYAPDEAATELRLRYGRQCTCTGWELIVAITTRGGDTMARTDWKTPGVYGRDGDEDRALWEIAEEMHDQDGLSWEEIAEDLEALYGVTVSFATICDRVKHYQQQRGDDTGTQINWQAPGVYHDDPLVEVAARLYDQDEEGGWQEVIEILEAELGIQTTTATCSRIVRRWREEGGAAGTAAAASPPPAPPLPCTSQTARSGAGRGGENDNDNDNDGAGPGMDVDGGHAEGCECGDCQNMRAHFEQWEEELEEEEDVFGDGGEGEPGPRETAPHPPAPSPSDLQTTQAGEGEDDNSAGADDERYTLTEKGQAAIGGGGDRGLMIDLTDAAEEALAINAFDVVTITLPAEMARALMLPDDNGEQLKAQAGTGAGLSNGDGDECSLEMHVPGVDLRITADGPVEYMQRIMQVGSQLTLAKQVAMPAIRDDELGRLDALEDALAERRAG